ncbi:MAG: NADH-quinone oxidoreductase subunit L [Clostridia bacterium]|nr:NADH-quinone oxidoreductase subunit L [Clostridia bacterium]
MENIFAGLVLFPFLIALALVFVKTNTGRRITVYSGCGIIMAAVALFAGNTIFTGTTRTAFPSTHAIDMVMLCAEFAIMILVVVLSTKHKKHYCSLLSIAQTLLIAYIELTKPLHEPVAHVVSDRLSAVMCLIVGIIGCLICIYAVGYMRRYHEHHKEYADRRTFFFPMLFVFIGAMFGLVLSSNLIWIYFFWEITSVSSFLLIGYTKTKEAIKNSFRALWMNLLGGLAFAIGIGICVFKLDVYTLGDLVASTGDMAVLAVCLLGIAGLTKSAQLPFSRWLLGAMVAPTPTSALLHSATMVKAGVYLLIRLSPAMTGNYAGMIVSLIGGITFFVASMLAITHSDGKKILAYSTVSNLGLITACAGVGIEEGAWAGILLMIFHAVSKSMLFQGVGAIENTTGSRDIEDMHGLICKLPKLAVIMMIGIIGMFIAPFGMLVSKWAALKAYIDADNVILVCLLCFGSSTTLFYWAKWLGKVLTHVAGVKPMTDLTTNGQWVSMWIHAALGILLCALFPVISLLAIEPMLHEMFGSVNAHILTVEDMIIMVLMLFIIMVIPFISKILVKRFPYKPSLEYMSGINMGDNRKFDDAMHEDKKVFLAGWYMEDMFGERKLWIPSVAVSTAVIVIILIMAVGGAI